MHRLIIKLINIVPLSASERTIVLICTKWFYILICCYRAFRIQSTEHLIVPYRSSVLHYRTCIEFRKVVVVVNAVHSLCSGPISRATCEYFVDTEHPIQRFPEELRFDSARDVTVLCLFINTLRLRSVCVCL